MNLKKKSFFLTKKHGGKENVFFCITTPRAPHFSKLTPFVYFDAEPCI